MWIVFDPRTGRRGHASQTIYVGAADLGTSIYRSTDGGATWAALPGQPTSPAFMPHHAVLASTGMMYITYNNNGGPYDGSKGDVWKYDTATGAWTTISPVPSSSGDNYFGYGGLAVDAQHPDTLMVSALNAWWPDTMIWRSTNGGASWTRIWDWGPWPDRILRYVHDIAGAPWLTFGEHSAPPVLSPKLGWMVGDLEIDPFNPNRMLYGTGATIYGTDDLTNWDAGNPITISVRAQGLEETAVQDLISPPEGAPLLSALADIAGFRHDDLSVVPANMFTNPTTGTTTSLDYAELSPNVIVRVGWGGSNAGYSFDGGSTWTPVGSQPGGSAGAGVVALSADGDERGVESRQQCRALLDGQRLELDGVERHPERGAGGVGPRDAGPVLRLRCRHVLREHQRRRELHRHRRRRTANVGRRALQGGARPRGSCLAGGRQRRERVRPVGLERLRRDLQEDPGRGRGGHDRLRQGGARIALSRALHERPDRRGPRDLPLR